MSLGVAFALTAEQVDVLLGLDGDDAREEWLQDLEEQVEDLDWFQYDKAWDELHRCLGDGRLVIQDGPPLAHAVFGSQPLIEDDDAATFAGYLPASEVPAVAAALREVDQAWLRRRLEALDLRADEDPFAYVWDSLTGLREFYGRLVERRAAMVFSVG
jgi:hypothetical protein